MTTIESTTRPDLRPGPAPRGGRPASLPRLREALALLRSSREKMVAERSPSLECGIARVEELITGLTERLERLERHDEPPIEAWAVLVDAEGREVSRRTFCVIEPDGGDGNRRLDRALELAGEAEDMERAVRLRLIGCDGGHGELPLDDLGGAPLWFERTAS